MLRYPLSLLALLLIIVSNPSISYARQGNTPNNTISLSTVLSRKIPDPPIPAESWTRARIAVTKTDKPPTIDGELSEPIWQTATHAIGFHRFGGGAPVVQQTEAWMCADRDFLYVAFHCLDSEPGRIRSSETQRGGELWNDDHVTVTIDSQGTRRGTSSFVVSARGTQSEYLEGGTAGNITWAGDWKAATKRTDDGWVAEMAIPFRLLRYPRGANAFGILLYRRLARETNTEIWPYVPADAQTDENAVRYMNDFAELTPSFYAPRPVVLPYVLASGGDGEGSIQQGVDIKYPVTTTLTGLVAIKPDFKTIEQDVASINFSYNEQFVDDRRPFFAEGSDFFPGSDIFYSRRISRVDEGLKLVGKDGNTSVAVLGAFAQGGEKRNSMVMRLQRDLGIFSNAGISVVSDSKVGIPSNQIARFFADWGGQAQKVWRWDAYVRHTDTWQQNEHKGGENQANFQWRGTRQGLPSFYVGYSDLAPDFVSNLGLVRDLNRRGGAVNISQENQFDRGAIESYYWELDGNSFNRYDGSGFFRDEMSSFGRIQNRRGYAASLFLTSGHRRNDPAGETFHDRQIEPAIYWNQRTLFSGGRVSYATGQQAGERYRFLSANQGIPITRNFSTNFNYARQVFGTETTSQIIATGTYRLSDLQTVSARLVRQDGTGNDANVGANIGTNLYFAFAQRSRHGTDFFLLLGDPNEAKTKAQVTLKLLRPY